MHNGSKACVFIELKPFRRLLLDKSHDIQIILKDTNNTLGFSVIAIGILRNQDSIYIFDDFWKSTW